MTEYAEGVDLLHLASELVVDAVIEPEALRAEVIRRFALYGSRERPRPLKRHGVIPT
jgi:acetyl-CoA carboxylase carboxyltransferase component